MIPDKEPVNTWSGNSSNMTFDFDFLINSEDELLVLHTNKAGVQTALKLNIDYTIHQTGNADGSYIIFPILGSSYKTLGEGEKITLMLDIPIAQNSPYGTSDKLNLKSLEFSLDYIVRLIQMVNRKAERSVKVQEGSSVTPDDLIESLNQAQINANNSAQQAAASASSASYYAVTAAEEAAVAAQKTAEISEIYTEAYSDITTAKNDAINTVNNIKETIKYISELELCDIGMSLYVDETKGLRRRLNGQVVAINANTQAFLNRLKQIVALYPSLSVTETAWQAAKTASAYGQVGRFVIDEEAGTVRLPAVVNVQGALDLQNLGLTVEAGLPNIEGDITSSDFSIIGAGLKTVTGSGALGCEYKTTANTDSGITTNNNPYKYTFDASESNSIYGNSDTVQPEAIQYPYFIQIATGQETENNIVNELELYNPFVLLEPKYSESLLYNESWLRSNGQWNAKTLYVSVYEALQVEYNSEIDAGSTVTLPSGGAYTKRGLPVKLSTEVYTDYDHVLNTADEMFRLALKTNLSDDSISGVYLYFYAGAVSQNAGIINTGRLEEALVDKVNAAQASSAAMPSNSVQVLSWPSSGSVFTAPADGYYHARGYSQTSAWTSLSLDNIEGKLGSQEVVAGIAGSGLSVYLPAAKGQRVSLHYENLGDWPTNNVYREFRFIPTKGAAGEV